MTAEKNRLHRWCVCLLLLPLLLLASEHASAQRPSVECRVETGFSDVITRKGGIFPVAVTIENKVASTTGLIEISQPEMSGAAEVRHVLPFESPAPSVKRFIIPVRIEQDSDLELDVRFRERIRPVHLRLTPRRAKEPLVLCLGTQRGYAFGQTSAHYAFISLPPSSVPVDPVALDGVYAVMFFGADSSLLSREQIAALRQWARTGGRLVFQDPVLDAASARNLKGLLGDAATSVARRGITPFGAGYVASSGPDAQPNLAFWDADPALAAALFPIDTENQEVWPGYQGIFPTLWSTRRSFGILGGLSFMLIIVIYIIVIGPVDRWLVRRWKKPYLTWFIFPAAIAGFSAIAYGYSYLVTVDIMRMVSANVVDTAVDSDVIRGCSSFWVYSAKNATYQIDSSVDRACFSSRQTAGGVGAPMAAAVEIANSRQSSLSARIPVFSSRDFNAAWYAPWPHRVVCRKWNGEFHVSLPPELKVDTAYLADEEGLSTLTRTEDGWSAGAASREEWKTCIPRLASKLQNISHYSRSWSTDSDEGLLPSPTLLRDYLLFASFPSLGENDDDSASQNQPWNNYNHIARQRSHWERSLAVPHRKHGEKTLLLFLSPDQNLFPVSIKWNLPRTARVDLVRVCIPANLESNGE